MIIIIAVAFLLYHLVLTHGITWELGNYTLPTPMEGGVVFTFHDNIVYYFGGRSESGTYFTTIYKLDTNLNIPQWQLLPVTMPVAGIWQREAAKVGDKIYFYNSGTFNVFDIKVDIFENLQTNNPHYSPGSSLSTDGTNYIYLTGGEGAIARYVVQYNIIQNEWIILSNNAPLAWLYLNTMYYPPLHRIYVFGTYASLSFSGSIYHYDLNSNTWIDQTATMTFQGATLCVSVYIAEMDRFFIVDRYYSSAGTVNSYDPISNTIYVETARPNQYCGVGTTVTTLHNKIQLFGGTGQDKNCRTQELYTNISPTNNPSPTSNPTNNPTNNPSPTSNTTNNPTNNPTHDPIASPTNSPTAPPTSNPSHSPIVVPTASPSYAPSISPSNNPTSNPNINRNPSLSSVNSVPWTFIPSLNPTFEPTLHPSKDYKIDQLEEMFDTTNTSQQIHHKRNDGFLINLVYNNIGAVSFVIIILYCGCICCISCIYSKSKQKKAAKNVTNVNNKFWVDILANELQKNNTPIHNGDVIDVIDVIDDFERVNRNRYTTTSSEHTEHIATEATEATEKETKPNEYYNPNTNENTINETNTVNTQGEQDEMIGVYMDIEQNQQMSDARDHDETDEQKDEQTNEETEYDETYSFVSDRYDDVYYDTTETITTNHKYID